MVGLSKKIAVALSVVYGLGFSTSNAFAQAVKTFNSEKLSFKVEVLTDKLSEPWGMAFLPGKEGILITEKKGNLRLFKDGKLSKPIANLPKIADRGQGGLLDVALDPNFSKNRQIYFSFTEPGRGGFGTAVVKARLEGLTLRDKKVIYRQSGKTNGGLHFGSRLAFAPDGTLFITNGDRGRDKRAQDPKDHPGSVLRINSDGSIPADNPFKDGKIGLPEIWSFGHRNPQGATIHPKTGELWTVEHGARGGDEINRPEAGKNYGWPTISYGTHYSGRKIGIGTKKQGLEQPLYVWDPSIAPSGLTFYSGDLLKPWNGDLFVGALKFQLLVRLKMDGNRIVGEERLLEDEYGRIRDVRQGPDGALYLLTDDSDGLLLRLSPA